MKDFQVRSREVRAASQQLMRELRQARAARSRHKPLRAPSVLPAPAKTIKTPAAAPSILPSRKILAAETIPSEAVVKAAKVKPPKPSSSSQAEQPAPLAKTARPEPARLKAVKRPDAKIKPAKPGPAKPEPVEAAVAQSEPLPSEPPKPAAPRAKPQRKPKVRTDVAVIIAEGLAPVAALQQAVTAALEAKPTVKNSHAELPISTVPSLGPGMVWRLNQLGLRTLADLAAADAETLRLKLGKLGRMVNVEQWIAYARAA